MKNEPPPPPVLPEEPHHEGHRSNARIVVPAVIGAIGVIGLGVGIGMGLASQTQQSDATNFRATNPQGFCANQASVTCQTYQGILNSQQQDTNVSRVMLVGGGVLAVAAVVTYLAWPHARRERGEQGAWIGPTLGGVGGAF